MEYPKNIIKLAEKRKVKPKEVWIETVKANIPLFEAAIAEADIMNWGHRSHVGNKTRCRLSNVLRQIKEKDIEGVLPWDINLAVEIRRTLCDLMWMVKKTRELGIE